MKSFCTVFVAGVGAVASAYADCREPTGDGFVLKGDIALQVDTGLEWQRCALGMHWSQEKGTCIGEPLGLGLEDGKREAEKLSNGWRVPTAKEFDGIFLESCSGPKIDTIVFPQITTDDFGDGAEFWTTTEVSLPRMYYYFNVTHGYADAHSDEFSLFILPVRNQR